ncbi:MAG TPA: ribonuclease H-like domain-containing protein [Candidatus Acidoferrales bacterium]|nr:ribonuclease H-like domain-containing protein [Candidatus Acidoferrales bacterium]
MNSSAQDKFAGIAALRPARRRVALEEDAPRGISPDIPAGAQRLAEILGASTRANRYGEHLGLRRWFSEPSESPLDGDALRLMSPDAHESALNPEQWLFLDTETTGLAGGTGTYAFLVGIAWWDAGGLEVEQFFMREHSEEHSLLQTLAERMAERRVLVTFNGKAFDWPLLETRYQMTRKIKPPAPKAHLDFLHPARNLWRRKMGSVRLAELEREVLGLKRGPDVMSELIPSLYYDFLSGGPPEPLIPIFLHNQMDLCGLAGLSNRVLAMLADPESGGGDAFELFGVSRLCERRGQTARAKRLYAKSLETELPADTGREARRSLAKLTKKDGDFTAACAHWEALVGNSREGYEAYEQLAIHYEHHAREPQRAAAIVRKALGELRRANRLGTVALPFYRRLRARFDHRLARLERKAGRGLLDALESESQGAAAESNQG